MLIRTHKNKNKRCVWVVSSSQLALPARLKGTGSQSSCGLLTSTPLGRQGGENLEYCPFVVVGTEASLERRNFAQGNIPRVENMRAKQHRTEECRKPIDLIILHLQNKSVTDKYRKLRHQHREVSDSTAGPLIGFV